MPVIAASEAILALLLGIVGIGLFWTVGHEVERDVKALGSEVLKPIVGNIPFLVAALVGIFLIVRGRK
jgi:hypothetical protein